jgi:hypothetical protein
LRPSPAGTGAVISASDADRVCIEGCCCDVP